MDIKHITNRIICFPRYYKKWRELYALVPNHIFANKVV